MDGQLSFATLDYAGKKKRTKRDVFLTEMAAAVPWSVLEAVIAPHYPKEGPQGGRRAFPIAVMLRIYCLQQWYNLSDPGAEEALYDIQSMRAFCNLELGRDPIPDETTILNFRHLLEAHELTKTVFEAVAEYLEARGALLRGGTIVDATLIAASPSTKNGGGQARSAAAFLEEGQPMVCVTNTGNWPVVLYRRWEQTSRSRLAGAGFKPPGAAAFKRRGGERPWKSHPSGWQVRVEKMSESKPFDDASLRC